MRVGDAQKMKLQGLRGRSWSRISPTKESRLQCVDNGEPLKTFKQANNMVRLTFLIKHSDRCVDWLIGFQDRWLEMTLQIRDDKGYTHSSGDGQRWQEHLLSFCCVLGTELDAFIRVTSCVCSEARTQLYSSSRQN